MKLISFVFYLSTVMRKTLFPLILLGLILTFGCKPTPKQDETIRIATLRGPSSMGMIKLIDSLSLEPESKIKVDIFNEPIQVRKMVIEGSADFALLPTTMATILYNRGMEYKLLAIPVWGTLYLFGNDSTITQWEHLKGKKINAMAKGMTPDVLFRYLLEQNGLNPDRDVELDYSFPTHIDLANAVAAGQSTLGVISEPTASMVMQRNKEVHAILDLDREWQKIQNSPLAQTALIVKQSFAEKYPEILQQMVSSYKYSTRWVNTYPDSAAALMVKHQILPDEEIARNAIPRSNLNYVEAKDVIEGIYSYLSVFYEMNPDIIGGKLPHEDFIY